MNILLLVLEYLCITPSGFVHFQEDACATIDATKLNASYISELTNHFIMLTDARNISLARKVYGKLLCIQDLLSPSDESRKKDKVTQLMC